MSSPVPAVACDSDERLLTHAVGRGIQASPLSYQVNGVQYVAMVATNTIEVLRLP